MPAQKIRRWFITTLIAMVILGVAAGLALSRARDAGADTVTGALHPSTSPSVAASTSVSTGSTLAAIDPSTPAPRRSGKPQKARPSEDAGPVIAAFRVTQKPACPSGTDQVRFEGRPVVLAWKVTGAETVTLSVDGPGVYDSYPAEGTATIDFPCGAEAGGEQVHTYTLAVKGPEGTESKTLTVTARVNEMPAT